MQDERELSPTERLAHIVFCINIFSSLEEEMVRAQVLRVVSLPLWHNLSQGRLKVRAAAAAAAVTPPLRLLPHP